MTTSSHPSSPSARTWFITGATSGIGQSLTVQALAVGDRVAALARNPEPLKDLAARYPDTLLALEADVRDAASVDAATALTVETFGRIDVVANNAGYGLFGAVEEATDSQARAVFDTNVFGVLNVLRATLPILRNQRSGHVLQGSSLYGQSSHPGVGLLSATKYAVEGLTDALAGELAPLGIKVTLVQPGPTASNFLANLDVADRVADYDQTVREVQKAIGSLPSEAFATSERVAAGILRAVESNDPPLRLALGACAVSDMRAALTQRLDDLDAWNTVSVGVDR